MPSKVRILHPAPDKAKDIINSGVWAIVTGEPIGILPALAGATMGAAEFYQAGRISSDISEYRAKIASAEN